VTEPVQSRARSLCHDSIIKHDKTLRRLDDLSSDILPDQSWRNLVARQLAIDGIIAELLGMFGKVRQRIIDLTDQ
jgi:hypothetical protein